MSRVARHFRIHAIRLATCHCQLSRGATKSCFRRRASKNIDTGLEEADHPSASVGAHRRPTGGGRCLHSFAHRCPPEWRGDDSTRTERQTPTGSGSRWRKSLGPAGPNRRRRQFALWCDSSRDGQAVVIEHRESAHLTDRFAKPKQSPAVASRTGAQRPYQARNARQARSSSVCPLLFLLSPIDWVTANEERP
jgi:hypothetical protein